MLYTLQNDVLTVKVSDIGAEIHSVTRDGCEYIWVGDAAFWSSHAPWLFPVCGRFLKLNTSQMARPMKFLAMALSAKHP